MRKFAFSSLDIISREKFEKNTALNGLNIQLFILQVIVEFPHSAKSCMGALGYAEMKEIQDLLSKTVQFN